MSVLDIASDYVAAGISVIPLRLDGSKAPAVKSWTPYRHRFATDDELQSWFAAPQGIGIVCGLQSGGMEVIDFDHDAEQVFPAWRDSLTPAIRGKLCVIETGGLGYHVPYRSESSVCGNEKIAMSADGKVTFTETRGEGGYVVGVGSPIEVHSSGSPYVQTHGLPLPELPTFTAEERRLMWSVARSFDQRNQTDLRSAYKKALHRSSGTAEPMDPSTPWGDYCNRANWSDILDGWTTTDGIHWTRPAKKHGTSGKITTASDGQHVLTVFSANAGPLSPGTGGHQTFNKFSAYAAMNHNGDLSAAAKHLRSRGYGQ